MILVHRDLCKQCHVSVCANIYVKHRAISLFDHVTSRLRRFSNILRVRGLDVVGCGPMLIISLPLKNPV